MYLEFSGFFFIWARKVDSYNWGNKPLVNLCKETNFLCLTTEVRKKGSYPFKKVLRCPPHQIQYKNQLKLQILYNFQHCMRGMGRRTSIPSESHMTKAYLSTNVLLETFFTHTCLLSLHVLLRERTIMFTYYYWCSELFCRQKFQKHQLRS